MSWGKKWWIFGQENHSTLLGPDQIGKQAASPSEWHQLGAQEGSKAVRWMGSNIVCSVVVAVLVPGVASLDFGDLETVTWWTDHITEPACLPSGSIHQPVLLSQNLWSPPAKAKSCEVTAYSRVTQTWRAVGLWEDSVRDTWHSTHFTLHKANKLFAPFIYERDMHSSCSSPPSLHSHPHITMIYPGFNNKWFC